MNITLFMTIGVVLGILDWIIDIIYTAVTDFENDGLQSAAVGFILLQPLFYGFVFAVYGLSHPNSDPDRKVRMKYLYLSPLFSVLMYFKLLPAYEKIFRWFSHKFKISMEDNNMAMFTIENYYRLQIFVELFLQTIPMMIIQVTQNSQGGWEAIGVISFIISLMLFLKDTTQVVGFMSHRIFDNVESNLRPTIDEANRNRRDKNAYFNLRNYLNEPDDQMLDEEGNTSLHQATKLEELEHLETQATINPHMLFILNQMGMTPLDMAIFEGKNDRAELLLKKSKKFHSMSSIRFVTKPNRLELKYEKSFTLAVQKNNNDLLFLFPNKSIKTMYVPVYPMKNYEQYKFLKSEQKDVFTTPIHVACRLSNDEAIRVLIERHQYNMNILLEEKSPTYELISTSTYQDLVILSYAMKTCSPDVNAGVRLPINQAIERGNKLITKVLLEYGKPNYYKKDADGFAPIHIAGIKRDIEMFQMLVKRGADPTIPDKDGNTVLHHLCEGAVKDSEFQFIKDLIEIYNLRLTRNNEHMTPYDLIRSYPQKSMPFRNVPNLRREVWDYFEEKIKENPDLLDSENYEPIHLAVIKGELGEVDKLVKEDDVNLDKRDMDGKTPFMLSIEHERVEIADLLFKLGADVKKRESKTGNTALHIAARAGNFHAAKNIMEAEPSLALSQNYEAASPFHVAIESRSMEVLRELEQYKIESLTIKNTEGENPLFLAGKVADKDIFEWFSGKIDFFKARGDRNYKGQTIEHYVCMLSIHDIVHHIKPLPDTKDYYGNLPIFYSIQNNDALMINKYFKKGKQYFHIRNFKNQNLFHIAGIYNSFEALTSITKNNIFFEELLKKDYKGNTPIHVAAKSGSTEVLEFYLSNCTRKFLDLENDFGLTPLEIVKEKLKFIETEQDEQNEDDALKTQVYELKRTEELLETFEEWVCEERWNYDISYREFLSKCDPDLKLFMGFT